MRNGIWVRILNVLNLNYERLGHNSAKVVPLQVFGKFSVSPPYACECFTQLGATTDRLRFNDFVRNLPKRPYIVRHQSSVARLIIWMCVCRQNLDRAGSEPELTYISRSLQLPGLTTQPSRVQQAAKLTRIIMRAAAVVARSNWSDQWEGYLDSYQKIKNVLQ